MPGLFITFEGPEGSGKSTHVNQLDERLDKFGYDVVTVREPGGTPTGEAIRHILQYDAAGDPLAPQTELLLFEASRAQLVARVIKPALERDAIVICDRFMDSTTAYQGYGRDLDVERVLDLNAWATNGLVPDITLLMDLDVQVGFDRLRRRNRDQGRSEDRFECEARAFHERVRQGYLALAQRWPERFHVVASHDPVDAVSQQVWSLIEPRLAAVSDGRGTG